MLDRLTMFTSCHRRTANYHGHRIQTLSLPTTSFVDGTAGRAVRRKARIAATITRHPYSTSITQPGSALHDPLSVLKCHWTYVGIMLTVQTMISRVEADVRNGSSQRRYQGNTTGAHKRDAATGQANWSGDHSGAMRLSQVAVTNPTSNASPTSNCGGA